MYLAIITSRLHLGNLMLFLEREFFLTETWHLNLYIDYYYIKQNYINTINLLLTPTYFIMLAAMYCLRMKRYSKCGILSDPCLPYTWRIGKIPTENTSTRPTFEEQFRSSWLVHLRRM